MATFFIRLSALLVTVLVIATACGAEDGSIIVVDARYRIAREDLGAGYLSISNSTEAPVTLIGASASGVGRIELHESVAASDGAMSMQPRPEGFLVEPGELVEMRPGGKHLMLFGLTNPGQELRLVLDFGSDSIEVAAAFDAEASATGMTGDMANMDHGPATDAGDVADMDHGDG